MACWPDSQLAFCNEPPRRPAHLRSAADAVQPDDVAADGGGPVLQGRKLAAVPRCVRRLGGARCDRVVAGSQAAARAQIARWVPRCCLVLDRARRRGCDTAVALEAARYGVHGCDL